MVFRTEFTQALVALQGDGGQDVATQPSIWSWAPRLEAFAKGSLRLAFIKTALIRSSLIMNSNSFIMIIF